MVKAHTRKIPYICIPLSLFLPELMGFFFLSLDVDAFDAGQLWPLAFGGLWAVLLGCALRLLPQKAGRAAYGIVYTLSAAYAAVQTGYYILFSEMMWISDFRYASEGSDYFSVLLSYPAGWWLSVGLMIAVGAVMLWKFPKWKLSYANGTISLLLAAAMGVSACFLPNVVFLRDSSIRYSGSDYGRAQSGEAAYVNMFNTHRLYQVCGLYQTAVKDIYANVIYPSTPAYVQAQAEANEKIDAYFEEREESGDNEMTGILEGKNVVLVLMESMDDWLLGEYTPTINRLMSEGINFTKFYTPGYGGVRTFNTEFCINTGSFLSSAGGYAFDYVNNDYSQSLASLLTEEGYSAKTFHYNDPSFYSRGVYSLSMGYEEYVCYADYIDPEDEDLLYDDQLLFDNEELSDEFFREEEDLTLNFIITRSAHLSYKYNEVLSYWGLKQYPEFRGLTGNEEEDCAYLKARLVDDLFARLLEELEEEGELEDTVIIAVTDHYTYGIYDEDMMMERSGVEEALLLENTPCFIWSADMDAVEVDKVLNTSDLLPTVLNMLGVETDDDYIGQDAFDDSYQGYALFSDGSWITGDVAYDASEDEFLYLSEDAQPVTEALIEEMAEISTEYIYINNLILESDYYDSP